MWVAYLVLILAWLLAPLVELVIIIGLYVENHRCKKRIEELSRLVQGSVRQGEAAWAVIPLEKEPEAERESETQEEALPAEEEWLGDGKVCEPRAIEGVEERKPKKESVMAMAALMIGVVFVVLAGLIFATTAWRVLPSYCKVFLVAAFSLVLFAASFLAEKKLHIHKTGNAFYLLGSVFLFFTVLAAGYFRILGPEFIWEGINRWRVLFVGSLVTVAMMFLGVKRFHHEFYTQTCFWGVTVSLFYLMAACQVTVVSFVSVMMIYGFLLVVAESFLKKMGKEETGVGGGVSFRQLLVEGFGNFAISHFWAAALLMSGCGIFGVLILPGFLPAWHGALALAALTAGVAIQAAHKESGGIKGLFSLALVILIHYTVMWVHGEISVKMEETVSLGQWKLCVAILVAEALVTLSFLTGRKGNFRFRTAVGDGIYTAFMGIDAFLLGVMALTAWCIRRNGRPQYLFLAAGGILLLAIVVNAWEKECRAFRGILPFLLLSVVLLLHGAFCGGEWISDEWIGEGILRDWLNKGLPEFLLFAVLAFWDWRKRRGFGPSLLIMGTVAQVVRYSNEEVSLPFFFLISVYLLSRALRDLKEGERGNLYFKVSSLYGLAGIYVLTCPFTADNAVLRMMVVILSYGVWLLAAVKTGREKSVKNRSVYWDVVGCVLLAGILAGFYLDSVWKMEKLLLCLAAFGGFYLMFYRGRRIWPHWLATVFFFPMPIVLAWQHDWSRDQFYLFIAVSYLFTGILAGRHHRICEREKGIEGGWRVDWYHVMALFMLIPMAAYAEQTWQFVYLLLIGGYFLQFWMVRPWRKAAGAMAAAALVLAFWRQPFVTWPPVLDLEIRLLPLVFYLWGLGLIWPDAGKTQKDSRILEGIRKRKICQNLGYVCCLLVLCGDAWRTGDVADALMVEGICLVIFIGAQIGKSRLWVRVSGILMVAAALYMTKGFWLSISWWVYLLAAGIGLILFAAVKEKKRRRPGEDDD